MKSAGSRSCPVYILTLLAALIILAATSPAQAYYYAGGDWGGQDLTLLNGDSLAGTFSNVGQFYIPSGAFISGGTDNLVVKADRVLIDGSLNGLSTPRYDLEIYSLTNIILNGTISSWQNAWLAANDNILLSETSVISMPDGGTFAAVVPISTPITIPTPIPAAGWLLGSGLLGLVGVRRKRT